MNDKVQVLEVKLFENSPALVWWWDGVPEVRASYDGPAGTGTVPLGNVKDSSKKITEKLSKLLSKMHIPEDTKVIMRNGSGDRVYVRAGEVIAPPLNSSLPLEFYNRVIESYGKCKSSVPFESI